MKFARKFSIPVFAAATILAGVSALAVPAAANAAVAHPSSAASVSAASARSAVDAPAATSWYYWSSYGTNHACNVEGDHLVIVHSILTFKCVGMNGGEYVYYDLWVLPGMPPGA